MVGGKDGKNHVVKMFAEVIGKAIDGESLGMKLLGAPPLKFYVDKRDIVYSVQKLK